MPSRLVPIYLNDHLAGSIVDVELARRWLLSELVEDRATLIQLMERLAVPRSKSKTAAAWTAEKLGRLKLNRQITGYSPLSRLVELEGLATGIEGKRSLWPKPSNSESWPGGWPERSVKA